jgi:hypothetical protein
MEARLPTNKHSRRAKPSRATGTAHLTSKNMPGQPVATSMKKNRFKVSW